ncbi:MAG: ORF6N domain-containing protein [Flavobacteriaceae bacterium]|jgi:NAD dependent epimerase/dehydratase family enzyme|nr:ORF6N domain-containing protein [Flavobacteriaceae bacterium]
MQIIQSIQNRIYEIRGERVMLDRDLAALYEIETRIFNQAVKRNIKRFPKDFMFQLTKEEWDEIRFQVESMSSQIVMSKTGDSLRSQIVILKQNRGQHSKYLPYAFTEQGVAMLSGILNSDRATNLIALLRKEYDIEETDVKTK